MWVPVPICPVCALISGLDPSISRTEKGQAFVLRALIALARDDRLRSGVDAIQKTSKSTLVRSGRISPHSGGTSYHSAGLKVQFRFSLREFLLVDPSGCRGLSSA